MDHICEGSGPEEDREFTKEELQAAEKIRNSTLEESD